LGMQALVQKCMGVRRRTERPQFLILGLDNAGKTTLLYRLKLGSMWDDIKQDMAEMRTVRADGTTQDPGYHYEELSRRFHHGIWDVPGTEAMRRLWRCFYQAIKIHCVIFVVDASDTDDARMVLARRLLHALMNEDELRSACFCVVVNQKTTSRKKAGTAGLAASAVEDELHYRLGLHNLHPSCDWRTRRFNVNILELRGETDRNWHPVLEFARETLMDSRGYGMKL